MKVYTVREMLRNGRVRKRLKGCEIKEISLHSGVPNLYFQE